MKTYKIVVRKKVARGLLRLPVGVKKKFFALTMDLRDRGPIQNNWPNYSKIGRTRFHCHLSRSWVACWKWVKGEIEIEVYYVGSRENAPY